MSVNRYHSCQSQTRHTLNLLQERNSPSRDNAVSALCKIKKKKLRLIVDDSNKHEEVIELIRLKSPPFSLGQNQGTTRRNSRSTTNDNNTNNENSYENDGTYENYIGNEFDRDDVKNFDEDVSIVWLKHSDAEALITKEEEFLAHLPPEPQAQQQLPLQPQLPQLPQLPLLPQQHQRPPQHSERKAESETYVSESSNEDSTITTTIATTATTTTTTVSATSSTVSSPLNSSSSQVEGKQRSSQNNQSSQPDVPIRTEVKPATIISSAVVEYIEEGQETRLFDKSCNNTNVDESGSSANNDNTNDTTNGHDDPCVLKQVASPVESNQNEDIDVKEKEALMKKRRSFFLSLTARKRMQENKKDGGTFARLQQQYQQQKLQQQELHDMKQRRNENTQVESLTDQIKSANDNDFNNNINLRVLTHTGWRRHGGGLGGLSKREDSDQLFPLSETSTNKKNTSSIENSNDFNKTYNTNKKASGCDKDSEPFISFNHLSSQIHMIDGQRFDTTDAYHCARGIHLADEISSVATSFMESKLDEGDASSPVQNRPSKQPYNLLVNTEHVSSATVTLAAEKAFTARRLLDQALSGDSSCDAFIPEHMEHLVDTTTSNRMVKAKVAFALAAEAKEIVRNLARNNINNDLNQDDELMIPSTIPYQIWKDESNKGESEVEKARFQLQRQRSEKTTVNEDHAGRARHYLEMILNGVEEFIEKELQRGRLNYHNITLIGGDEKNKNSINNGISTKDSFDISTLGFDTTFEIISCRNENREASLLAPLQSSDQFFANRNTLPIVTHDPPSGYNHILSAGKTSGKHIKNPNNVFCRTSTTDLKNESTKAMYTNSNTNAHNYESDILSISSLNEILDGPNESLGVECCESSSTTKSKEKQENRLPDIGSNDQNFNVKVQNDGYGDVRAISNDTITCKKNLRTIFPSVDLKGVRATTAWNRSSSAVTMLDHDGNSGVNLTQSIGVSSNLRNILFQGNGLWASSTVPKSSKSQRNEDGTKNSNSSKSSTLPEVQRIQASTVVVDTNEEKSDNDHVIDEKLFVSAEELIQDRLHDAIFDDGTGSLSSLDGVKFVDKEHVLREKILQDTSMNLLKKQPYSPTCDMTKQPVFIPAPRGIDPVILTQNSWDIITSQQHKHENELKHVNKQITRSTSHSSTQSHNSKVLRPSNDKELTPTESSNLHCHIDSQHVKMSVQAPLQDPDTSKPLIKSIKELELSYAKLKSMTNGTQTMSLSSSSLSSSNIRCDISKETKQNKNCSNLEKVIRKTFKDDVDHSLDFNIKDTIKSKRGSTDFLSGESLREKYSSILSDPCSICDSFWLSSASTVQNDSPEKFENTKTITSISSSTCYENDATVDAGTVAVMSATAPPPLPKPLSPSPQPLDQENEYNKNTCPLQISNRVESVSCKNQGTTGDELNVPESTPSKRETGEDEEQGANYTDIDRNNERMKTCTNKIDSKRSIRQLFLKAKTKRNPTDRNSLPAVVRNDKLPPSTTDSRQILSSAEIEVQKMTNLESDCLFVEAENIECTEVPSYDGVVSKPYLPNAPASTASTNLVSESIGETVNPGETRKKALERRGLLRGNRCYGRQR